MATWQMSNSLSSRLVAGEKSPGNLMLILKIENWEFTLQTKQEHKAIVIHPLFARSKVSQLFIQRKVLQRNYQTNSPKQIHIHFDIFCPI